MNARIITIDAAALRRQVWELVESGEVPPLSQADCPHPPIVDAAGDICDGMHRVAGMIAAGETAIACVTCDDTNLLGEIADAEHPAQQANAIRKIYDALQL
jgi:hypothetical protein